MSIFDNYTIRMETKDTSARARRIERIRYSLSRQFEADPSYFEANAVEPDGLTASYKKLKVINANYETHLNPARVNSRYFISHPDTPIASGTVLFDIYGADWMATSSANLSGITDKGMMQRMNFIAKWVKDGAIAQSYSIITGVSRRSDGVDENFYMTIPNDSIMFHFPKNNLTSSIKRDMRFIVQDMPYKITRVDGYTDPNIYYMIAVEDQLNSKDNLDLGIADYYEPDATSDLVITGEEYVSFGMEYVYTVQNLAEAETVITWELLQGLDYIKQHTFNSTSGTATIEIKNERNVIGKTIEIRIITSTGRVRNKLITITSLL